MSNKKNVVVIGGGTGIFPVTQALKHLDVDISSIVTVSDSGGSTGRIRDEFGFQPVGDLRQSLAALAEDEGQEWIRKLLLYRFSKGSGLKGHNLGNLILTALQDLTGSTSEALFRAQQIFRLDGQALPATNEVVDLKIVYEDGSTSVGEHTLDEIPEKPKAIDHVELTPPAKINPYAKEAIEAADLIIIGPGDYFASLMASLAPTGTKEAIKKSKAKIAYVVNLMTRFTQTQDMSAKDHVTGIEEAIGRKVDTVIMNDNNIPEHIVTAYAKENEYPVKDDLKQDKRVVRAKILSHNLFKQVKGDALQRSLLRHDSKKLEPILKDLLETL